MIEILREREAEAFCRELRKAVSPATAEKYGREARHFVRFCNGRAVTAELAEEYKNTLTAGQFSPSSVNGKMIAVNRFFSFLGVEIRLKGIRQTREIYRPPRRELTKEDYKRLVKTAQNTQNNRTKLILQTLACTGMRVSELRFVTAETLKDGEVCVLCKARMRKIFLPKTLRKHLKEYAQENGIKSGVIFRAKDGRPLHRTTVWRLLKALCPTAKVERTRLFPHNLRHLFAREFYKATKDIARLADVLGHSSIETTRIYLISTGEEHARIIENLHLIE